MVLEYAESNQISMTATEKSSIEDSIMTIASTPYGTAPFMRSMGIRNYPPESDSEIARNQYATEAMTQCRAWEDRARVSEVIFGEDKEVRMVIGIG